MATVVSESLAAPILLLNSDFQCFPDLFNLTSFVDIRPQGWRAGGDLLLAVSGSQCIRLALRVNKVLQSIDAIARELPISGEHHSGHRVRPLLKIRQANVHSPWCDLLVLP